MVQQYAQQQQAWCKWSFMNQDAPGVQWLRVQEAWKKSAPLFALFYLSSLVASPSVSFFFSHLLLYLYTFNSHQGSFSLPLCSSHLFLWWALPQMLPCYLLGCYLPVTKLCKYSSRLPSCMQLCNFI